MTNPLAGLRLSSSLPDYHSNQVNQTNIHSADCADIQKIYGLVNQSLHFSVLQEAQQCCLLAQRQLSDFVEEQRSSLRHEGAPQTPLDRSSERATGVA